MKNSFRAEKQKIILMGIFRQWRYPGFTDAQTKGRMRRVGVIASISGHVARTLLYGLQHD